MRIARFLALAGVAARRKCEGHIQAGEVAVNGEVVHDLGRQVDPERDEVTFRGRRITLQSRVYYLLNKPAGYTTTAFDPYASHTVYELLPPGLKSQSVKKGARSLTWHPSSQGGLPPTRVFPVGRLDRETTGLLLFTNDGELAHRLMHPSHGAPKTYEVHLNRRFDRADEPKILSGIRLAEGLARAEELRVLSPRTLRLVLREGKKREIRRILGRLGYEVVRLTRVSFSPLTLGDLAPGEGRYLTPDEVEALRSDR